MLLVLSCRDSFLFTFWYLVHKTATRFDGFETLLVRVVAVFLFKHLKGSDQMNNKSIFFSSAENGLIIFVLSWQRLYLGNTILLENTQHSNGALVSGDQFFRYNALDIRQSYVLLREYTVTVVHIILKMNILNLDEFSKHR